MESQKKGQAIARKFGKYGVAPKAERTWKGIVFSSKGEMLKYLDLKLLERAGHIRNLRRQVARRPESSAATNAYMDSSRRRRTTL